MNVMVESLKRLYKGGKISSKKLNELLDNNVITKDEYMFILN